ncbi:MAG: arsenosugar biosynthesis radical SAM protein ArsS [Leptospiraceae bacterium]|nr:arsenosugar biosynthesis radical SAM protein ArsS [Leptospiraceae bacterium]
MISSKEQVTFLSEFKDSFLDRTKEDPIQGISLDTFQINVGRWCNQTCRHCHVDASPKRTESMTRETAEKCMQLLSNLPMVKNVDITGGAPEGNSNFRYLVEESKRLGKHVMDRCNLTILEEKGFEYLYEFLSSQEVEIIASLPHFAKSRTDSQRGRGVFDVSIHALQKLNKLGYGTRLPLNLVYNPSGLFLAPSQSQLEREYKEQLLENFGIQFTSLYCINNIPVNRFLNSLIKSEKFDYYMNVLVNAFNIQTLEGLMCRHQISIGYDGFIYDCDFNQMLELKSESVQHISEFNLNDFLNRRIVIGNHCYACTAGNGSSCGGEIQK